VWEVGKRGGLTQSQEVDRNYKHEWRYRTPWRKKGGNRKGSRWGHGAGKMHLTEKKGGGEERRNWKG